MLFLNELFIIKNTYEYYEFCNIKLKFFIFILFIIFIFFFNNTHTKIYEKKNIEINNIFEIPEYENNKNYSYNNKEINPIAFYYPEFTYDKNYNYYFKYNIYTNDNDKKNISIIENKSLSILIRKQIDLAKSHGIYGFAIYFKVNYCLEITFILEKLAQKDFYFPFFLIWNNEELENKLNSKNDLLNKQRLYYKTLELFIKKIKKYLILEIYININDKPVLSINKPSIIPNIIETLVTLRKKAKENHIGEIFIFFPFRTMDNDIKYINLFDGSYDLSENYIIEKNKFKLKNVYYSGIIYKNIIFNFFKLKKSNENFGILIKLVKDFQFTEQVF